MSCDTSTFRPLEHSTTDPGDGGSRLKVPSALLLLLVPSLAASRNYVGECYKFDSILLELRYYIIYRVSPQRTWMNFFFLRKVIVFVQVCIWCSLRNAEGINIDRNNQILKERAWRLLVNGADRARWEWGAFRSTNAYNSIFHIIRVKHGVSTHTQLLRIIIYALYSASMNFAHAVSCEDHRRHR